MTCLMTYITTYIRNIVECLQSKQSKRYIIAKKIASS